MVPRGAPTCQGNLRTRLFPPRRICPFTHNLRIPALPFGRPSRHSLLSTTKGHPSKVHIRAYLVLPPGEAFANFLQHLKVTVLPVLVGTPLGQTHAESALKGTKGEELAILVGAYGDLGGDSEDRKEMKV